MSLRNVSWTHSQFIETSTLSNCTFTENASSLGVFTVIFADVTFKDCKFMNNYSPTGAANIASLLSVLSISSCSFEFE